MREQITRLAQNFCVTAGAGAGKTTCLVQAYVNLLAGVEGRPPLRPEQAAAITFTEKAAGEMRVRIQKELARRARAGEPGPDWAALLTAVEWAPITTIHSFCAALLREFGAYLSLDPDFAVLDEQAFGDLMAEAVAELCRAGLQEADPVLTRVLAHLDLAGLAEVLTRLHAGLATQGLGADQARQATAQAHAEALARGAGLLEELEGLVQALAQGLNDGSIKSTAKFSLRVKQIIQEWPNTRESINNTERKGETIAALAGLFSNNWGKYNPVRQAARDILEQMADLDSLPMAEALADDLLALAGRLAEAVEREMTRRAALSFDHLLLLALRLVLEHPRVLAELRGRYRALMVDEFQDVNPVQGRLVMLLAGLENPPGLDEARGPGEPAPTLLLVGDRKQSIYAFRGADVGVFSGAQEIFAAGAGELAALPENFRSNQVLVEFFNDLFAQILAPPVESGPFPELALAFAEEDRQAPARPDASAPDEPIQVLDCRALAEEDASLAAWREAEALALADHLAGLIAAGTAPGHIALLFRRLTQVGVYEQALRRAGVDYYTVRGRGFYACREVADLDLALRAVLDPGDDLALAGLLRSPLVGLSDEALLALCHPDEGQAFLPLGRAVASGQPLPDWLGPEQGQRLARAREMLAMLRPLARRLGPAELLECLVESSDLLPLWHATPGGAQRAANLRKLIEGARQPGPGGGIEDFARHFAELVASPPEDPQAPLMGEEAPVVRLMSVHQAKGLQFPVVALPDLAAPLRDRDTLALGPGGVLGAAPWSPEQGRRLGSPVRKQIKARGQALERAEAARLFYVACTRAQERLVFCLNGAPKQHQGPWGQWVRDLVLPHPAVSRREPAGEHSQASPRPAPVQAWPGCLPPEPGPLALEGARLAETALAGRPRPPARVTESVSGLENWLACPRLWFFTRRLGLDTASLDTASLNSGTGEGAGSARAGAAGAASQAAELGSLVHRLLELADLRQGPDGLETWLAGAAQEFDAEESLARKALDLARGLWDTPLPSWLADIAPGDLRHEEPFHLFLGGGGRGTEVELVGEFDLLAPLPQGGWLVADYKVSAKVEPEKYRAQMALYALALWQGQGCAGPLPRMALCYLTPTGGRLAEMSFSAEDLAHWRDKVLAAGRAMAEVPANARALDLPVGEQCSRDSCALARSGLCPGKA